MTYAPRIADQLLALRVNAGVDELAALALECLVVGRWMLDEASLDDRLSGSAPFLTMCAVSVAGWQLLRQAEALTDENRVTKSVVAEYFVNAIVTEAAGLTAQARLGSKLLYSLPSDMFTAN